MSWLCCAHKTGRSKREEVYRMADEENNPKREEVEEPAEAQEEPLQEQPQPQPVTHQFSWDKRERVDLSKVTIGGLNEETLLREDFEGEPAIIEKCKDSILMVLGHTSAVTVDDCSDCLIVLGPCRGSVFIRDCFNCCVMTICQQLRTRDCHNLELALRTMSQPIIEQSTDVVVRPLALYYNELKAHMRKAGLDVFRNEATSVHDFTPDKIKSNYKLQNNLMKLSSNGVKVLCAHGVHIGAPTSLFPVPMTNATSISFAYQGVAVSSVDYQEDRHKLMSDLNASSKLAVMCAIDLEITPGDKTYIDLPLPVHDFGRLSIVGCSGWREEFEHIVAMHGGYEIITKEKSEELQAAMFLTGILE